MIYLAGVFFILLVFGSQVGAGKKVSRERRGKCDPLDGREKNLAESLTGRTLMPTFFNEEGGDSIYMEAIAEASIRE